MKNTAFEHSFSYRSYSKGELALMYNPYVSQKSAVAVLNSWIQRSPGLAGRLSDSGLTPYSKKFTPMQVRMIVEALGEP